MLLDLLSILDKYIVIAVSIIGGIYAIKKYSSPIFYYFKKIIKSFDTIYEIQSNLEKYQKKSTEMISRIEKRQVLSSQREKAVLQESNVVFFETNEKGYCVWVNKAYELLTGRSSQEIIGYGWENSIPIKEQNAVADIWNNSVEKRKNFEADFHITNAITGKSTKIKCKATVLRDESDNVIGWFGTMRPLIENLSEKKITENS